MAAWKYKLGINGQILRNLIHSDDDNNENKAQIIEQIEKCCNIILNKLDSGDKEWYEDSIQE